MSQTAASRAQTDRIVWIDCEMTGLDLQRDALIEVAALVTDFDLTVLGEGVDLVVRPPEAALAQMGDFVRQMHTDSGLLDVLTGGVSLEEAQQQVLDYVRAWVPEAGKAPLGGNTVSTDRAFLARDMPQLESYLHYRIIDVSSVKELSRRWYPRAYFAAPEKTGGHRALGDIQDSIAELRYYREAVFRPPPGLDSAALRTIAARHGGAATEAGTEPAQGTGTGTDAAAARPAPRPPAEGEALVPPPRPARGDAR